ncbi:hypothetical protein AXF42_Ash012178 [Apostasia shenzhenica]|uniref:Uncharacterized protein n=1 Tax=Apostasia shenzhenica TaxID=1088818 RepID=A0A2I0B476_9ASPA|nr:hypothetical protein AXF42_Ash012178 [Apostasia shenzhenica]
MKRKAEAQVTAADGDEELHVVPGGEGSAAKRSKNKKNVVKVDNASGRDTRRLGNDEEDEEAEENEEILKPVGDGDICRALMERYARSSAPQHRHLCATAAAMRSILSEEGLPLTPPAYFAAAITAVRDSEMADHEGAAALSSFLALVLPLVPPESLPKAKARDAAFVLASYLRDSSRGLPTGCLRSMVKSLGLVALRVDFEEWDAVQSLLETLFMFSFDKRPKVRRCAQSCLEMVFKGLDVASVVKKASKFALSMHKKYLPLVKTVNSIEVTVADLNNSVSKPEHMLAIHMLNAIKIVLPYLSDKVRMKILCDVYKLLGCHFSWTTRHVLKLLEALVEHSAVEVLVSEAESTLSALSSYVSSAQKNPVDTVISASTLVKSILGKLQHPLPRMWTQCFPLVFTSLLGYLRSDSDTSELLASILKELVEVHIDQSLFSSTFSHSGNYDMLSIPEASAVSTICNALGNVLESCCFPPRSLLVVISSLFFKLGGFSCVFMKEIVIRLSQYASNVDDEMPNINNLEQCIGAAVISMGPEQLLAFVPVSFDVEKLTCSNTWIIPILKKYIIGASLQYFMDRILPTVKSLQKACERVNNKSTLKRLQRCSHRLWDLLPAFCRYPVDISENFESLSKLFAMILKEDPSLHEIISSAMQVLINSNRKDGLEFLEKSTGIFHESFKMEFKSFSYSKKLISRNLRALSSSSIELFEILKDIFFHSSSESRGTIKVALGCFGFVISSEYIGKFLLSLKNVEQSRDLAKAGSLDGYLQSENTLVEGGNRDGDNKEDKRCLLMELASAFVEAADNDLTNIIFDLIRSLLGTYELCQCEAYCTLSAILKEKDWFCSAHFDEIMKLLFTVKPPADNMSLKHRLSCFDYLLVYMLKSTVADTSTKAFLILNEIILTLKTKKASRKLAYDALLSISGRLKSVESVNIDSDLLRLFNMVMGYLSSSSPHIMSGAVSALSLLIYHDAAFCLYVPNLIPSVLVLLQNKANEVIKATLGFIKVLVSSLNCNDLIKLLPDILQGILSWSSVSKYHFRSKVGIILEILMRKCSYDSVDEQTPQKYKGFVKSIKEGRQNRKTAKGVDSSNSTQNSAGSISSKCEKKGLHGDASSLSRKPFRDASNIQNKSGKKVKVGFSNKESYRNRVRRKYVRNQADQTGMKIKACHRSKVNHRMKINSGNQKQNYSMIGRKRKFQFHKVARHKKSNSSE